MLFVIIWLMCIIGSTLSMCNAISELKQHGRKILSVILSIFLITLLFLSVTHGDREYKRGNIDAINGIIKYELRTQEDNSEKWVKIKGE